MWGNGILELKTSTYPSNTKVQRMALGMHALFISIKHYLNSSIDLKIMFVG